MKYVIVVVFCFLALANVAYASTAVDQAQQSHYNYRNFRNTSGESMYSQGFVPSVSGLFNSFTVSLCRTNAPIGNVYGALWSSNNNGATSTPSSWIATSTSVYNTLDISASCASYPNYNFIFKLATAPYLRAGTSYHLVLSGDWELSTINYLRIADYSGAYTKGTECRKSNAGTTWSCFGTANDLYFIAYRVGGDNVTVPTRTAPSFLANISSTMGGGGFLTLLAVAIGIPLTFYVARQIIGLLPKSRVIRGRK